MNKNSYTFKIVNIILCSTFCIIVFINSLLFLINCLENGRIRPSEIKAYFSEIEYKTDYINLYGMVQNILGKQEIENFSIYKNSYDELVSPRERLTDEQILAKVQEVGEIWDYLEDKEIPYIYIAPPLPIADISTMPLGVNDFSQTNADVLHSKIINIPVLNLAEFINIPKEKIFYRTDHHWSGDTVFESYLIIMNQMVNQGFVDSKEIINKPDDFKRVVVDGFLGSYGIKVGKYYDGCDQYVFYEPLFSTNFSFVGLDNEGQVLLEHSGSWYEALMDSSILNNPQYSNKYNASLWGNPVENRIINNDLDTGKLLIISHSYGRPLAQYFAFNFHEVRHIDPQEGRFIGNYITYIDEYEPDIVLFLIEFEGEIIGNYRTSD